jgi:hypothetical protein
MVIFLNRVLRGLRGRIVRRHSCRRAIASGDHVAIIEFDHPISRKKSQRLSYRLADLLEGLRVV